MDERGADDADERGGNECEQEEKRQFDDGTGLFLVGGFSEGADDAFGEFPDEEKGNEEGGDWQAVGDPGEGLPGPLDG